LKIWKQISFGDAEEREPETTESTLIVLNLTEGLRLTETADADSKVQRAASAEQRIMRLLAFLLSADSKGKGKYLVSGYLTISSVT
jgi:hypothetical protein